MLTPIHALSSLLTGQDTLAGFLDVDRVESPPPRQDEVFGRYRILGLLGSGGMGAVYRAWDLALEEVVALKVLRRELLARTGMIARFRQEVRLARRVAHPNVVRTYDLGEHGGECFLTMEYVAGRSLRRALSEDGPLAPERAVAVARGVAAGMGAAHQAGVLHCDLKPDNILLGDNGRVAITDFGVARAMGNDGGGPVGTPAYMSPEQLDGRPADGRADLYALGVVLYEVLTGERPWIGSTHTEIAAARAARPSPDPGRRAPVPGPLTELVARCLAPQASDRFADAAALDAALREVEVAITPTTPVPEVRGTVPSAHALGLAVLPLRNGGLGGDGHLAEGLTEELIDALATTRGLRVRPLSSVLHVDPDADAVTVGAALGVAAVVQGTVRRVAERVRVSVRVIGVEDGFQLWARRLVCDEAELLAMSDRIAAEIATALAARLDAPARAGGTDRGALDLYLRARQELREGWDSGAARAAALFAEALRRAPDDADILAGYAMALARESFYSADRQGEHAAPLARCRWAAERAVARAPGSGEAWLAMAHADLYTGDVPAAARALLATLDRSPGQARAQQMLGNILLEAGRVEDAMRHLEAAVAIDPDNYQPRMDLVRCHALAGRWGVVEALLEAARGTALQDRMLTAFLAARLSVWGARLRTPPWDFPEADTLHSQMVARALANYREILETGTLNPRSRDHALRSLGASHPLFRAVRCQLAAEMLCATGDVDQAADVVRIGVEAGLHDLSWMERCPVLPPLRAHPAWRELYAVVADRAERVRAAVDNAAAGQDPRRR